MARRNQLSALVLILCLSLGHAAYSPWARWILTTKWLNNGKIKDSLSLAPDIGRSDSVSITTSSITCASYHASSSDTFNLVADFTSAKTASQTEFGISIWAYFESNQNSMPFSFDKDNSGNPYFYRGYLSSDGKITFKFTDNSNVNDGSLNFDIPLDSGKWLFFAFYWSVQMSGIVWSIFSPSLATLDKTSSGSNTFYMIPGGYLSFGNSVAGYYYEIQVFKRVSRSSAADLLITLVDKDGYSYAATTSTCPNTCYTYCYPDYGCLSTTTCQCPLIYNCDSTGTPTSCKDSTLDVKTACQCPLNCAECSSKTVCTQCNSKYYLHDKSGGTECVCNFHVACTASCNSCEPDAACYECANSVVKDEGNCRVDSVGFQVSFSYPYIVLNFAHPLERQLTVGNLVAKTADGTIVPTTGWTIDASSTSSQLKVKTTLNQSQLPISLNLKFGKV